MPTRLERSPLPNWTPACKAGSIMCATPIPGGCVGTCSRTTPSAHPKHHPEKSIRATRLSESRAFASLTFRGQQNRNRGRPHHSKPETVAPDVREVPAARGRAGAALKAVPRAAPQAPRGIAFWLVIFRVSILSRPLGQAPLPNVSAQVVCAVQRVGLLRVDAHW